MIEFPGFLDAARFVDLGCPDREALNQYLDISIIWGMVSLVLKTRNAGGATAADIATAKILDRAARELIEPE